MAASELARALGLDGVIAAELDALDRQGLRRQLRCVEHEAGCHDVQVDGRAALSFASCDYLGLAGHPRLARAAADAATGEGTSSGSARLLAGNDEALLALEAELAGAFGAPGPDGAAPAALVFSSGYLANLGLLTALAGPDDLLVSDRLGHASTVDACRLTGATVDIVPHNDLDAVSRALEAAPRHRRTFVLAEGLYSMDGDVAPLAELVDRAEDAGAHVLLDDAHGLGSVGPDGRGAAAAAGVAHRVTAQVGNLGKALGSFGAFVVCSPTLRELLVQTSRPFVFTCAPPPPVVAAAREALAVRRDEPERTARLRDTGRRLRAGLAAAGIEALPGQGPIVPVVVGDGERAVEASRRLLERGVFVPAVRPPTVPAGSSRLRLTVTAAHSPDEIDRVVRELAEVLP